MQLANRTPFPLSSVLQDAYEFPEVGYVPGLHVTTLVPGQSEGNPAVCYRPCSCHWCYSSCLQCLPHPPILMSTLAFLKKPHQVLPSASLLPMHSCRLVLNNGLSQALPVLHVKSCHCNWYPSPFACVCNHRVSFYSQSGSLSSTTTMSQSKSTTVLNPRSQKHPVQVHFSIIPNCNKPRS